MQPYGAPAQPEAGTSSTVKTAVGLTMTAVVLAVVEAIIAVYMQQGFLSQESGDDIATIKTVFGILIGFNLVLAAGLSGGAILTLRRSVVGKVMIWAFGVLAVFMRLMCGGMGVLFAVIDATEENSNMPWPVWTVWLLIAIEVLGLLAIGIAMIMLMTKGASFPQPPAGGPPVGPGGYGAPYGTGSPVAPPMPGPPTSAPPDGLPHLPPTPGWPGG